jgi:release factor glutamine methyltransferase
MPTIKQILTEARTTLTSPDARLEAELLLEAICAISRSRQFSHPDEQLREDQFEQYKSALERRLSGEPLAHITGRRGFWDVDLRVTPDVLIPRSDTEILVEQALQRIPYNARWQIADLGTGSGAIAIVIARERPQCELTATDNSAAALAVARENATALGVNNISFVAGSWGQPLKLRQFDVILSNPPYIRTDDPHMLRGDLPAEPIQALVSGSDGLDAIRRIIKDSATSLKPNGWLLLEHGYDQAAEVSALLQHADFNEIFTQKDYGGNSRVTGGRRQIEA